MSQSRSGFRPFALRSLAVTAAACAVTVPTLAAAQSESPRAGSASGEGQELVGGVRNPRTGPGLTRETEVIGNSGRNLYGTRQSNKGLGGGAIYGCRSTADGTSGATLADDRKSTPCLRVNNLKNGLAFQFQATGGPVAGLIQAGPGFGANPNAKPFITNATGVATGLNADQVDGQDAGAFALKSDGPRWALVDTNGAILERSDDRVTVRFKAGEANANTYLDFGSSVAGKPIQATLAIVNNVDRDGAGGVTAEDSLFAGQIAAARCGGAPAGATCAPPGTNDGNHVVVRTSDAAGAPLTNARFYVTVG